MSIIADVATYIESNITLFGPLNYDAFCAEGHEEIIIRSDPSPSKEQRYLDESRIGKFGFSVLAKSQTQATAEGFLWDLIELLDLPALTDISEGVKIKCETSTNPLFVSKAENGEWIYTSSFELEYYVKKEA